MGAEGRAADSVRIASWADQPITLAQDSVGGRAEAELVDVGAGTSAADYAGKAVRGKLVLTSSQPEAAAKLAVTERGAAGIVSWAQNQRSAWWGEDESLIRWGHLSTWEDPTFAFMVSPAQARAWQARLAKGEAVRLRAEVKAGRTPGAYLIPTAVIPGKDRSKEILFSCHLDHPSPGANDNASGCAGILEIARTFQRLIAEGRLPQPRRTLRFIWPCEIECTIALLNAKPEYRHPDPGDRPSRHDRRQHARSPRARSGWKARRRACRASSPTSASPSPAGSMRSRCATPIRARRPSRCSTPRARRTRFAPASAASRKARTTRSGRRGAGGSPSSTSPTGPTSTSTPTRTCRAISTPTKMKRAMFIAATSAWYLANLEPAKLNGLEHVVMAEMGQRSSETIRNGHRLPSAEFRALMRESTNRGRYVDNSAVRFGTDHLIFEYGANLQPVAKAGPVYRRNAKLKGPMDGFGYSWLDDHLKRAGLERPALLSREPIWDGPSFGYEALNLVDGRRSVGEIRDALAATVGPAPVEEVAAYLAVLERLGVIQR